MSPLVYHIHVGDSTNNLLIVPAQFVWNSNQLRRKAFPYCLYAQTTMKTLDIPRTLFVHDAKYQLDIMSCL